MLSVHLATMAQVQGHHLATMVGAHNALKSQERVFNKFKDPGPSNDYHAHFNFKKD
jgi:hypothetical protein